MSRELGRWDKKRRKRKVAQSITSAIFGTAAIVADTQLPPLFAFSYGLVEARSTRHSGTSSARSPDRPGLVSTYHGEIPLICLHLFLMRTRLHHA